VARGLLSSSRNNDKERVLAATDLVRLIGEQVSLKRKGREFACLCPFHDDHNPSMYVVPSKQIYHCFVCGAGGDAIRFTTDYFKMGFREALQYLADRAGIQLSPPPSRRAAAEHGGSAGERADGGEDVAGFASRETLLAANGFAQSFFRAVLAHAEHGATARELIARRGISPEIVERFGLGAAPDKWDGLVLTLSSKGLDPSAYLAAGLLKRRENSPGMYDALRHRLTFPIHDALGRVIGFGGRKLREEDEPKYLNSPETLLFNKSATLYGLHHASASVRQQNCAIVTEGYMDCIACHQAGVTNVVATLGTALTSLGVRTLRRLCDTIVLFFDGDDAGQRAADRAIEAFFAEPVDVQIATMSAARDAGIVDAKDPDELLKRPGGAAAFARVIAAATPALDYRLARLRARLSGLTMTARARAVDEEIARLTEIGLDRVAPIRRRMIIQQVARLTGVPEDVVARSLPTARAGGAGWRGQFVPPGPGGGEGEGGAKEGSGGGVVRLRTPVEQLIALALAHPELLATLPEHERARLFEAGRAGGAGETGEPGPAGESPSPGFRAVAAAMEALDPTELSMGAVLGSFADADREAVRVAAGMAAEASELTGGEIERAREIWDAAVREFRRRLVVAVVPAGADWRARLEAARAAAQHGPSARSVPRPGASAGPGG
jgi:DNA primase